MNVIFIAPPAAGKGTQAGMLSKDYNLYHLSTGDLLREVALSDTKLGKSVKELIDNGNFVSDELMFKLLKEKIDSLNSVNGIIFDGVPRTVMQAKMLEELLSSIGEKVDYVIYLDVEKEVAMKRATGRVTCPNCNEIYNIYFDKFDEENKCNNCKSMLSKRMDDTEEKFNHRFDTYLLKTKPVIEYYNSLGMLKVIKNIGTKYDIYENIKSVIDEGSL